MNFNLKKPSQKIDSSKRLCTQTLFISLPFFDFVWSQRNFFTLTTTTTKTLHSLVRIQPTSKHQDKIRITPAAWSPRGVPTQQQKPFIRLREFSLPQNIRIKFGLRLRHDPQGGVPTQQQKPFIRLREFGFLIPPTHQKQAFVSWGYKKTLQLSLKGFCCCGERGIRTPGTVSRTTV